jgi:hypothetical protein
MLDEANQTTAAAFYALGLLLPAASWMLMWLYAGYGRRLIDDRLEAGFLLRMTIKYVGSVVVYAIAALVSLVAFRVGLALCVGLTLLYLAPPHAPAFVKSARRTSRS